MYCCYFKLEHQTLKKWDIFNVTFEILEMMEHIYFGINLKETVTEVSKFFWREVPDRRIKT